MSKSSNRAKRIQMCSESLANDNSLQTLMDLIFVKVDPKLSTNWGLSAEEIKLSLVGAVEILLSVLKRKPEYKNISIKL